jgi:NifB/MoaA-like Fe-S oxidoreductase
VLTKIKTAQSTLEYALLISVVVGGLLTMQNYLKRSVQGRLAASADEIGTQYSPGLTKKFDNMTSEITKPILEVTTAGFDGRTTTTIQGMKQSQNSKVEIKALDKEIWVGKNNTTTP